VADATHRAFTQATNLLSSPNRTPLAGTAGLGVRKDAAKALKWYDKAYVAGHWRSPLALATLYAEGER